MRKIDKIIIHCSATPEGRDFTVADIDLWHRQRGFKMIGYHYVIYRDGSIHEGRPKEDVGAHCLGHNSTSLGICYIGGCSEWGVPLDTRTDEQKTSLKKLLRKLKKEYPLAIILGHNDLGNTSCPCFNARTEYEGLG